MARRKQPVEAEAKLPIDDMWTRRDGSVNHKEKESGRSRWRVRYKHPLTGAPKEKRFANYDDAVQFYAQTRLGIDLPTGKRNQHETFGDYAKHWMAGNKHWEDRTAQANEEALRKHLLPSFGQMTLKAIDPTIITNWIYGQIGTGCAKNSIGHHYSLLRSIMLGAVAAGHISSSPTRQIKISRILDNLEDPIKWVPTTNQIITLLGHVDPRYRIAVILASRYGLRVAETLGLHLGPDCLDLDAGLLHVRQQLKRSPKSKWNSFVLDKVKSGSRNPEIKTGTCTYDLNADPDTLALLRQYVIDFPPVTVEVVDTRTSLPRPGETPKRIAVALLITSPTGKPVLGRTFFYSWRTWTQAADLPDEFGFHGLRHFCAITLIANGVVPQEVQLYMRHASLSITINTYASHWPEGITKALGAVSQAFARAAQHDVLVTA